MILIYSQTFCLVTTLVGDFNALYPMWDENIIEGNSDGNKVKWLIINENYCCETHTPFSKTYGKMSSIDFSICSYTIIDSFEWNVASDLYTSDHYPIFISYLSNSILSKKINYNFSKAD